MINLSPLLLTIILSSFTFLITALGGAVIFFFKKINKIFMQLTLSFSAGIMIASSFFSLILEAIEQCNTKLQNPTFITTVGIFFGIAFIILMELFVDKKMNKSKFISKYVNENNKQSVLTVFAISLHNIPEGMCIGVAFAGASLVGTTDAIVSAILLAVGIGIQNLPEGSAISLPLRRNGLSRKKSFIIGSLSAIVEPIFGVIGAILAMQMQYILPFLLSFAAGAMIYVVVIELIPESQTNEKKDQMALFCVIGFLIMMILDVTLG